MTLRSKSIQEKREPHDGIRICIMRKPGDHTDWDIWMPTLAPSLPLHKAYQRGQKSWDEYVPIFNKEVIEAMNHHIRLLVHMAQHTTITILCWEKTPDQCHRRLIIQEALRIDPTLTTVLY